MESVTGSTLRGSSVRAAFVTAANPRRIEQLSGTHYYMLRALERRFNMVSVIEQPWPNWFVPVGRGLKLLSAKQFDYGWSPSFTGLAAQNTIARLRAAKPDIVFAVLVSPMTHQLVREFRVVHISDTTVRAMVGYYEGFTKLSRFARSGAERIEAKAIREAFLSLYPMRWAVDSALKDYGANPDRTLEIAWGANLDNGYAQPRTLPAGELRLLFVGVDWKRKGGQIAVDTVAELNRRGVACRLDVVGCTASVLDVPVPVNVTFHGFIGKSTPEGRALIDRLFDEATFFLLPTLAECAGMAFAEAAHHGLPSLSFHTGGLPSVIRSGETGMLLAPGAPPSEFADTVCAFLADPGRYTAMSAAAIADSKKRLNWETWGSAVEAAVLDRLAGT